MRFLCHRAETRTKGLPTSNTVPLVLANVEVQKSHAVTLEMSHPVVRMSQNNTALRVVGLPCFCGHANLVLSARVRVHGLGT